MSQRASPELVPSKGKTMRPCHHFAAMLAILIMLPPAVSAWRTWRDTRSIERAAVAALIALSVIAVLWLVGCFFPSLIQRHRRR
ncbi:MAG: hypothetical protein HN742_12500 [Lentisphaerae bacterium]|nr:hypothetical protein [Lentisphaerota bacterium]MBT5604891.1 hypothetical protein [Lentisphaerota bacterium]MBT7054865.1 hypothetical protein [Lentisphaerota bacterium]MBT7842689.1 hypothetical protein [Lentisphaerota bacterium]